MFRALFLSTHDYLEFGLTKSFKDVILGLAFISLQVENDLNNVAKAITDYVIWDSYTYGPIVGNLLGTIGNSGASDDVGVATILILDSVSASNPPIERVHA